MTTSYGRAKSACYFSYISGAAVFCLPALLFSTFHDVYGISYTLLGTLVLINFLTQLAMDLLFSFFARFFNVEKTVRCMPLITSFGFVLYGALPLMFPQYAYAGLALGTVVFSIGTGLSEVFLSPLIAAIPSKNPDREMSRLHSLYALGVVFAIGVSSVYLLLLGKEMWNYLAFFFAALPIITYFIFKGAALPPLETKVPSRERIDAIGFALCVICIFFGAAAELVMTNWASGYIEEATGISKFTGDVLGTVSFAVLLGAGRVFYSKFGRNIGRTLFWGMVGATLCYVAVGLSSNVAVNIAACALTGLFTSMLWPGTLSYMEEKLPALGVTAYAMLAAGGDLGASIAPQLMGAIVDAVAASTGSEALGMKAGMLVLASFPALGAVTLLIAKRYFSHRKA